jgi:hypothetical protein
MPLNGAPDRQRGQVAIVLALSFSVLLLGVGFAVDLGFGYAHRRQVANAADAAALAGGQALGRHYTYAGLGSGGAGLGATDYTDAMILQEIASAAAANVPPFPDPLTNPPWPAASPSSLAAYYLLTDGAGNITTGTAVGSGTIPPTAAGVRVEARLGTPTVFVRAFLPHLEAFTSFASARVLLRPLGATDAHSPFIVCGGGPNAGNYGTWICVLYTTPNPRD